MENRKIKEKSVKVKFGSLKISEKRINLSLD